VAGLDCEIPEKQKLALLLQGSNSLFFFSEFLRQTFPTNFRMAVLKTKKLIIREIRASIREIRGQK
jgi:hypothetical protein